MTTPLPLWLIPALPLAGFLVNGLLGTRLGKRFVSVVGVGSVGLATLVAWARLLPYLAGDHAPIVERVGEWIRAGDFTADIAFRLDPLSALMIAFVTFVGVPHPRLLDRLHAPRGDRRRLRPLLRLPEPLHVLDADARARAEPPAALRRLGRRGPLLVPADRLLLRQALRARGRQEGLRRQPHRRLGLPARHVRARLPVRIPRLRPGPLGRGRGPRPVRPVSHADRPLPLPRRGRQERPGAPLRLASRRDGRTDARLRPDPCRHDGHGRRLHGHAVQRALPPRPRRDGGRRRRRLHDGAARGADRDGAERHQEGARVLDGLAARLHVPGLRRRGVHGGDVPRHDARLLQGLPLPRRRLGHARDERRARHAQDGGPASRSSRSPTAPS